MIYYNRFELPNGLVLLVHEDVSTPLVAVNVLYKVGSRNENPQQTGFAHLFEHLMFGGSVHAPSFDDVVQVAGGESNAFTNQDVTNFYEVVPVENLDAMLWLESDRMMNMRFTKRSLDVQRKVVVEEFKETCLNQPYGDVWHRISELAYTKHPYRWPVIGLVPQHIEDAQLPDVKAFFQRFYAPNNAVVVLAGNISPEMALERVTYWFGGIPRREVPVQHFERTSH
jgi:zinc protease